MQSPAKISPGPAKLSILCYSPAKPCQAKYRDSSQGESMVYTNADHVGIILKSINGEVYLLDATSEIGVSAIRWKQLLDIPWHKFYQRMVFRKLFYQRTNDGMLLLDDYVKVYKLTQGLIGKRFNISALKLLRRQPTDSNEGYFCSELVASIYKFMKLLPSTICSAKYWPSMIITVESFSAQNNLQLLSGARLGEECIIVV